MNLCVKLVIPIKESNLFLFFIVKPFLRVNFRVSYQLIGAWGWADASKRTCDRPGASVRLYPILYCTVCVLTSMNMVILPASLCQRIPSLPCVSHVLHTLSPIRCVSLHGHFVLRQCHPTRPRSFALRSRSILCLGRPLKPIGCKIEVGGASRNK